MWKARNKRKNGQAQQIRDGDKNWVKYMCKLTYLYLYSQSFNMAMEWCRNMQLQIVLFSNCFVFRFKWAFLCCDGERNNKYSSHRTPHDSCINPNFDLKTTANSCWSAVVNNCNFTELFIIIFMWGRLMRKHSAQISNIRVLCWLLSLLFDCTDLLSEHVITSWTAPTKQQQTQPQLPPIFP